jgi:hypothetical protein
MFVCRELLFTSASKEKNYYRTSVTPFVYL